MRAGSTRMLVMWPLMWCYILIVGAKIGCCGSTSTFLAKPKLRGLATPSTAVAEHTIVLSENAAETASRHASLAEGPAASNVRQAGYISGAVSAYSRIKGHRRLGASRWLEALWPVTGKRRELRGPDEDEVYDEDDAEFELPFDAFPLVADGNGGLVGLKGSEK